MILRRRAVQWLALALLIAGPTVGGNVALLAQALTFTRVGAIEGPIDLVRAEGTFAYVARGETLTVFDISDPAAPAQQGAHVFPEKIWGFTVTGSVAYVAAGHSGLWILDVSNAERPTLRGSIKTPGQAKNIAVSGTMAVVADHMSGVDVIDISNRAEPILVGSVYTDGYARDVAMFGSLAYAVDNPTGFYVLDLSKPDPLAPVAALQSASAPRLVEVLDGNPNIAVMVGGVPYDPLRELRSEPAPAGGGGTLQLYDVSDPASPVHVVTYSTPGSAQRVDIRGVLAFVADGPEGLTVVDLSSPSDPQVVGAFTIGTAARDVAIADTAVLVLAGTQRFGSRTRDDGDVIILRETR